MAFATNDYPRAREIIVWRVVPAVLVAAAAFRRLADPDMWWHLAGGRLILDGGFPVTNTFSHTFPDHPWRFTQWLFGTLIALAESLGGFVAVQIVVCAFVAGAFLLVIATIRRDAPRAGWTLVLPLIAVGVLSARFRFVPRGDTATLLGLAAVHYLWVARPRRLPLFLFLTGCLWSNLHAGVVFGTLEMGIFGCAALLDRDRKSIRDALVCGAAFVAGSLVNPFLHYPYLYVLENLEIARRFPFPIDELRRTPWGQPRFAVLAALAILGLVTSLARRRYRDALLIAGSAAMAAGAVRFVPFLVVLGLPGIVRSFLDLRETLAARHDPRMIAALVTAPVLAAALFVGSAEWREAPPGLGANRRMYPSGAADIIVSRGFTGRMFNEFDQGGFLAWKMFPGRRVFIDGRGNAYPWDHFGTVARMTRGTVAGMLDRYGIDHAVVQRRPFAGNADWGAVFAAMGWELVHVEGAAYLFVRPGSPDAMRARADVFRSIVPGASPGSLFRSARDNPSRMRSELLRIDPRSLLAAGEFDAFGICAHLAGDTELALRFLGAGVESCPDDNPLRLNYAGALESSGRTGEAIAQYRRVVEEDPASVTGGKAARRLEAIGGGTPRTSGAAR